MPKTGVIFVLLLLTFLPHSLLSIKIHCNQAKNIREDHIHYCCKHPDGHNDITEECAKKTNFKMPSSNEEAPEDVTVEQAVLKGACWSQCVFQKFNFLHGNELDMNAVRKHYREVHALDPEYEKEMIAAFEHCHGSSEDATTNFMNALGANHAGKKCNARSSVILSCVIHYFFHNCPKDRWANTQECQQTLEFAKKCKDALTTM